MVGEGFVDVSFLLHCAVYALLRKGEVVYVGQSKRPMTRIYSHVHKRGKLSPWKPGIRERKVGFAFDGIWVRPCMLSELDGLEQEMIRKYQPKHNKNYNGILKIPVELRTLIENMPIYPILPPCGEPRRRSWSRI